MTAITFNELQKKYQDLLKENRLLKTRVKELELELKSIVPQNPSLPSDVSLHTETDINPPNSSQTEIIRLTDEIEAATGITPVNQFSDSKLKIALFMSLFRGRRDVYAKRWVSKK